MRRVIVLLVLTVIGYNSFAQTPPMTIVPNPEVNHRSNAGYIGPAGGNNLIWGVAVNKDGIIGTAGDYSSYRGLGFGDLFFHAPDFTQATTYNQPSNVIGFNDDANMNIYALRNGNFLVVDENGSGNDRLFYVAADGVVTTTEDLNSIANMSFDAFQTIEEDPVDANIVYLAGNISGTKRIVRLDLTGGHTKTTATAKIVVNLASQGTYNFTDFDFYDNNTLVVAQMAKGIKTYPKNPATASTAGTALSGVDVYISITVQTLALQSDGKIVFGGKDVGTSNGAETVYLGRLNHDGTLDATFTKNIGGRTANGTTTYETASISDIEINSADEIYVAGNFSHLKDGVSISGVAKFYANGDINMEFVRNFRDIGNDGGNGNITPNDIQLQTDGKLLIAGGFAGINTLFHHGLIRIQPNGVLDVPLYNNLQPGSSLSGINVLVNNGNRNTKGLIWRAGEEGLYNNAGYHPSYYGRGDDLTDCSAETPNRYDVAIDKFIVAYTGLCKNIVAFQVGGPNDGKEIWSKDNAGETYRVGASDLSPDGQIYAYANGNGSITLLNANTGGLYTTIASPSGTINDVAFDVSGTYFYVLSNFGSMLTRYSLANPSSPVKIGTSFSTDNPNQGTSSLAYANLVFASDKEIYFLSGDNVDMNRVFRTKLVDGTNTPTNLGTNIIYDEAFGNQVPGVTTGNGSAGGYILVDATSVSDMQVYSNFSQNTTGPNGELYLTAGTGTYATYSGHNIVRVEPVGVNVNNKYIMTTQTAGVGSTSGNGEAPWYLIDWGTGSFNYNPLPVTFGRVEASVNANGVLTVNWESRSEINSDHFDVEASTNGVDFVKTGTVASKAADGNSTGTINYMVSTTLENSGLALGLSSFMLLGFGLAAFKKRRKWMIVAAVVSGITILGIGCNKATEELPLQPNTKIYVRVADVDKDGKKEYSTIVQAIVK
ncbi:MAG: hypothetical protein ACK5NK_08465 [Niabella sp.]